MKINDGIIIDDEVINDLLWITIYENDEASEHITRCEAIDMIDHLMNVFMIDKKEFFNKKEVKQ